MATRLVLLCTPQLSEFESGVLSHLQASATAEVVGAVIDDRPPQPLATRLKRNLRRGRGGFVIVMAVRLLARDGQARVDTAEAISSNGGAVLRTGTDPYAAELVASIRRLSPDLIVRLSGFGIVQAPLLEITPKGTLSYHHGDMRSYRGAPPAFWELFNGETAMGVTVQRLNTALDAGEPIVERRFEIRPDDTLPRLRARILEDSQDMMAEAVERLNEPDFRPERITSLGTLYTQPNLRQWLLFQLRSARRLARARLAGG